MAGTVGDHSTDEFRLLKDECLFVLSLTGHSEPLTEDVLRAFFARGPVDREGRERYTVFTTSKLPGGRLRPQGRPIYNQRDPRFWYSDPEYGVSCFFEYRHSSLRWSGPMVYRKAPSAEDKEDEEVWQVDPQDKTEYHLSGIKLRHEALLDFLRGAGWLPLVQQPAETAAEPAAEPAAESTQSQSKPPEVASEAADTVAISGSVATFGTLAAVEAADTAMFTAKKSAKGRKKGPMQLELARAAKEIWPPNGIVPPEFGPADLQHAVENLYKREAEAKSAATGKKEKPPDPPSWPSYKRFLKDQRGT